MDKYRFIISGGGTGGHIYPAIAIADEICERYPNSECLFVGALGRMEMQKVPESGYKIIGLPIRGMQRRFTLKNLLLPICILRSFLKSFMIILKYKPDFIVGTGGYASLPICLMAPFKRVPYFIQEQNFYPGVTNRILSKKAKKIFVAYDGMEKYFPEIKILKTGNPIRKSLLQKSRKNELAKSKLGLDISKKTLLVIGGSLGAKKINNFLSKKINFIKSHNFQIIWQCGKLYFDNYKHYKGRDVLVYEFVKDMNLMYAAADVIISRAGAIAVSELCIVGKPVVFIPSPNVSEDHQTKNAQVIVNKNAGILVKESELESFEGKFVNLISSEKLMETLSTNIKKMALPDATRQIASHITAHIRK